MLNPADLLTSFDPETGVIDGALRSERCLSDLRGIFHDADAYAAALADGDPLVYYTYAVEPADGPGDLYYAIGTILPGRIGDEYYMTKGHLHTWRPAAEFYIGLRGSGLMLLEDEATGESHLVPLEPNGAVYVPGSTAHRTINTGDEPLTYLGIYPARAGHDYAAIAERGFSTIVTCVDGRPVARRV
ncbi:MAG: cupin domain-containing protein [Bacteroidetes bacterium]|nr:cupin domain-containing protein [Bacteroidota bacterium]